jgi:HK97 family phage major capsid protein
MGAYLDRLNQQHDEVKQGIDSLVDRAAGENRDVTDQEQQQVERDTTRLGELDQAIEHYTQLEAQHQKVQTLRGTVQAPPQVTRTKPEEQQAYQLSDDFASAGDYAYTLHRAQVYRDPEHVEKLQRATAHQLLADNPGIVPRPVLGPVVNLIDTTRPFLNSITKKPLPAGSFDRPQVTQHVAVSKQATEKTLTDSQKLVIGKLPVNAATYAGHLNISRQDIKWSSPGILQIVFEDFASIYAQTTCNDASDQFVASCTAAAIPIASADPGAVAEALYAGAQATMTAAGGGMPDTLWVSPDVWATLGGMTTTQGAPAYPSLSLSSTQGNPMGLKLIVDSHFAAGTMISGPSRLAEWYEDVDGLMQVAEPDVLGQLVGYAGYGAFLNVAPTAFAVYTAPVAGP